jgi:hypothetical protein
MKSNIYVAASEGEVIEKLNMYQNMAKKFISKNRKYQPLWKVYCLEDNSYCLIFKLVVKGHNTVKEQKKFYEEDNDYWNTYINSYVEL